MPGRAIWKGNIRFGDVDLPVKLHTAVKEARIRFHLLHKRDNVKLRQQMICAHEKRPVPVEEQAKGFEVEEGKYILIDPEELEQTEPEGSRLIEVHEFVGVERIDPVYFGHVYYLEPDGRGKDHAALIAALAEMDAAGICTWAMRRRASLGALYARGRSLRLTTLRYADEVIPLQPRLSHDIHLSERELEVGSHLISQLSAPFQPLKYENEHEKKLQHLIDRKIRGEKIAVLRPRRLKPTDGDRLLETLEASLRRVA